jgi:hypothetical protein
MTKNSTIGESVYNEKRVAVEVKSYINYLYLQLECFSFIGKRRRR